MTTLNTTHVDAEIAALLATTQTVALETTPHGRPIYRVAPEQVIATRGGWLTLKMKDGTVVKARKGQVKIEEVVGGIANRRIGDRRYDCRSYVKTKSTSGNFTMHNGDEVALKLDAKTLDEVYQLASKALATPEAELRARYKHLNPGMQRMNLGNRMRGASRV